MRVSLLRMAAGICILAACTEVLGSIPPSRFHFQTIVSSKEGKIGGWRAAQTVITFAGQYGVVACPVEVGVPFMTDQGRVSEEYAQIVAALAADEAARVVLASPTATMMSATLCNAFTKEMEVLMQQQIPGARVSRSTAGLTPSH